MSSNQLSQTSHQKDLVLALVFAVGTLLLLGTSIDYPALNYDDPAYLNGDGHVKRGLTWEGFQWALNERHFGIPVPLTWLSLMANTTLLGDTPGSYRLVNIFLHIANVLLVLALMRAILPGNRLIGTLVTLVFAWHPTRLESVVWISERKDVLSAFFFLLTLLGYLRYAKRKSWGRYLGWVLLPFTLSILSKPSSVAIPALLILLDYWPLRTIGSASGRKRMGLRFLLGVWTEFCQSLKDKVPLLLIAFAVGSMTWSMAEGQSVLITLETFTLLERLANLPVVYGIYILRLFIPVELAVFVPHNFGFPPLGAFLAGLFMIVAFTGLALGFAWKQRELFFGWAWFVGLLIPVSGLFQNGSQLVAFRYTYLSYIGLTLFFASSIAAWWQWRGSLFQQQPMQIRRQWLSAASVLLVGIGCAVGLRIHLPHWSNSQALWDYALLTNGKNHIALSNSASAALESGSPREVRAKAEAALTFKPEDRSNRLTLAMAEVALGNFERADDLFQTLEPRFLAWLISNGYDTTGLTLVRSSSPIELLRPFELADRGGFGVAFFFRALAAAGVGDYEKAIGFYEAAHAAFPIGVTNLRALDLAARLEAAGYDASARRVLIASAERLADRVELWIRLALNVGFSRKGNNEKEALALAHRALLLAPKKMEPILTAAILLGHFRGQQAAAAFLHDQQEHLDIAEKEKLNARWEAYLQEPAQSLRNLRGWPLSPPPK